MRLSITEDDVLDLLQAADGITSVAESLAEQGDDRALVLKTHLQMIAVVIGDIAGLER